MNRQFKNILVTGGCGFIGSNFIRYIFEETDFQGNIINVDKLTYAGNPKNLSDLEKARSGQYHFEKVDICDADEIDRVFENHAIDAVIHFAAESHVDRSISGPREFINTNIMGTFNLLESARKFWNTAEGSGTGNLFHHVSTDEVYGSLGETGYFYEDTAYDPRSPYSASKASSDHLVRSYRHTFDMPITLSNCSNNYGPYQFPEKLLPLMIINGMEGRSLPIYGDGKNVRDWLYVTDHCDAIWQIVCRGQVGETYNIGGNSEKANIDVVNGICSILDDLFPAAENQLLNGKISEYAELITFVTDRAGHDRRYAINFDKINSQLGWKPKMNFHDGLKRTIEWYAENRDWVAHIKSGEYRDWIEKNYGDR